MRSCIIFVLCLASFVASSTGRTCKNAHPTAEEEYGYCQAVLVDDTLYVSGSVGRGEMPQAIEQAYATIRKSLSDFDMDFSHVVKETVFTTDIEALKDNHEVRKKFYGNQFPASSWIQIDRLFQPDYVIEVEVTAKRLD